MYLTGKQFRVSLNSDIDFLPCLPSANSKKKLVRIEKNEFLTVTGNKLIGKYQYIEFCISGDPETTILLTEDCCNNCLIAIHMRRNK